MRLAKVFGLIRDWEVLHTLSLEIYHVGKRVAFITGQAQKQRLANSINLITKALDLWVT